MKVKPKKIVIVKDYRRYIDSVSFHKERSTYGRITDAIACLNLSSIERILFEFKLTRENMQYLEEYEQDVFDIEQEFLNMGINPDETYLYITEFLESKKSKVKYILNRVSAKYYLLDLLQENNPIPIRKYPNKYKNLRNNLTLTVS